MGPASSEPSPADSTLHRSPDLAQSPLELGVVADPQPHGGSPAGDRKYRIAFRMHAFPMALSNVDEGHFVEISDAFAKLLEYPREEVVGKTSLELGLWADWKQRDAIVAELQRDGSVRDAQLDFRTKSGEVRTGLFSADLIEIDGCPLLLTVMNDITDRLRAERERQISDERCRLVSELTSDYAYSFRVDAESGLVLDWLSGAIEKLTGFTLPEIQAREGWESLVHPDDAEIPARQLTALLAGRAEVVEYRIVTKAQETRWLRDYARPEIDPASGRLTHIHGAVQDITERHLEVERRLELEAQVQQSQKLESLGVLAGGIAHDFNNLLMTILGNSDLAGDDLPDSSPIRPFVQEIRRAAERATDLVRQLLAYAGKGRNSYEVIDLHQLVEEMTSLLRVSVSKKIQLNFEFAADLPATAADPTQIRQVCLNLVTNAAEAIGDANGTITLRTGSKHLDRAPAGEPLPGVKPTAGRYVYLEVADDGAGMDAEAQTKIFEPFFTTKFEGRGLGLAVVQGIVRGHAGWITVRSAVGAGSTIRAYFPVTEAPRQATKVTATAVEERRFDGRTILLVDDEEAVREVGRRLLERLGWRVVTASDGQDALAQLAAADTPYDAVLMDLTMPRLGGAECMPELRRLRPDLPVIFASGCAQEDLVQRCRGWSRTAFISKPFDRRHLVDKLVGVLE